MAHEFNAHRANKVQRDRVAQITGGYTKGDTVKAAHPSGVKRASGGAVKGVQRADGGPVKARGDKPSRASGGRVKKGATTVNVIVSPQKGEQAPPMAAMPPPPPMPPKPLLPAAQAPMSPMGAPPGPGMGGMPPPMPHALGGRAYKKGGAVKAMKKSKLQMSGEKHKRADGGSVPTPKPRP